ncbi:prophage Lp3 protein 18 [Liquorilactobacillus sucicola DSM 21376 = JCM 15457]|uniref:Uncharacterized protein n=1 Tax=Liquorilactobacillus sucicola DSM 21376 = JCM 15457 TaxID=1423806 RepID=A0A023D045_9LACO|nr:phage major capsid protein [Liquorilactobacillus sucicola]KRN07422.1 hypothetical protein FD15_GL002290 [Liquorilactobacillus sucicola DSM 21376 = JCM 15457]GAJ27543.1 prophage Lp3 protein 18 [Liquorilactobacillus sucicola DSM 21376 = JCM 15457]
MKDIRVLKKSEIRALEPDKKDDQETSQLQIEGYAIVFNEPSKVLDDFTEIIQAQALNGVDLSEALLLADHDYSKPLASVKANTLQLDIDDKGLHFVAQLDEQVSYAKDVFQNIQNGNISSMSFRFDVADGGDQFTEDEQGNITRTIVQIQNLYEVSTVTIPAYDSSSVDTRSYEKFIDDKKQKENKGATKKMTEKTVIKPEETETRSFEDYIRTRGEKRDGLTTDGNGVIIPKEVITPIFQSKVSSNKLADYVTVKQVSVGQGSYPISSNDPSKVLATKAELTEIGDVDAGVKGVDFKAETRAGKIYLSNELLDDNAINFKAEVQAQLQKLVDNTDNAQILALLKSLTAQTAKSLDDVKQLKNTKLDPSLTPVVIVNQSGFNWLDTLKDNEGRYMLTTDVQAPTGKALFGLPVVELADSVLPNVAAGKFPIFIGDLAETIALFRRNQVAVNWQQFDSYSQGLAVVVRNDYKFINQDATVAITVDTTTAG